MCMDLLRKREGSKTCGSFHVSGSWLTDDWLTKTTVSLGMKKPLTVTSDMVEWGMVTGTKLMRIWYTLPYFLASLVKKVMWGIWPSCMALPTTGQAKGPGILLLSLRFLTQRQASRQKRKTRVATRAGWTCPLHSLMMLLPLKPNSVSIAMVFFFSPFFFVLLNFPQ
ncbi:hypothetical protein CRUP_019731 [Coryphaenoides rupestris]|nr:hypothetical protein CRUP_019731 [Coryphaenoides rupestris]